MTQSFGPDRPSMTDTTFDTTMTQESEMTAPTARNAQDIELLLAQQSDDSREIGRNRRHIAGAASDLDSLETHVDGLASRARQTRRGLDDLGRRVEVNGQTAHQLHLRTSATEAAAAALRADHDDHAQGCHARFDGQNRRFDAVDDQVADLGAATRTNAAQAAAVHDRADSAHQHASAAHLRVDDELDARRRELDRIQRERDAAIDAEMGRRTMRDESLTDATRERAWRHGDEDRDDARDETLETRGFEREMARRTTPEKPGRVRGWMKSTASYGGSTRSGKLYVDATLQEAHDKGLDLAWSDDETGKRAEKRSGDRYKALIGLIILVPIMALVLLWGINKVIGGGDADSSSVTKAAVTAPETAAVAPAPPAPTVAEILAQASVDANALKAYSEAMKAVWGPTCDAACVQAKTACTVSSFVANGVNCHTQVCPDGTMANWCDGAPGVPGPRGHSGKTPKVEPPSAIRHPGSSSSSSAGWWASFYGGSPVRTASRSAAVAMACGPAIRGASPTGRICDAADCNDRGDWQSAGCR
jgi:hypothetical protein